MRHQIKNVLFGLAVLCVAGCGQNPRDKKVAGFEFTHGFIEQHSGAYASQSGNKIAITSKGMASFTLGEAGQIKITTQSSYAQVSVTLDNVTIDNESFDLEHQGIDLPPSKTINFRCEQTSSRPIDSVKLVPKPKDKKDIDYDLSFYVSRFPSIQYIMTLKNDKASTHYEAVVNPSDAALLGHLSPQFIEHLTANCAKNSKSPLDQALLIGGVDNSSMEVLGVGTFGSAESSVYFANLSQSLLLKKTSGSVSLNGYWNQLSARLKRSQHYQDQQYAGGDDAQLTEYQKSFKQGQMGRLTFDPQKRLVNLQRQGDDCPYDVTLQPLKAKLDFQDAKATGFITVDFQVVQNNTVLQKPSCEMASISQNLKVGDKVSAYIRPSLEHPYTMNWEWGDGSSPEQIFVEVEKSKK